jgi:TonB family protein
MKMLTCTVALLGVVATVWPGQVGSDVIYDKDVHLADFEDLSYPGAARVAHVQGIVVVRVTLDDHGRVASARAISGNEVLIPDSLDNVKTWRFQPNTEKAAVVVYNFRMVNADSKSGCSHFMLEAPNFASVTACVPKL